MSAVQEDTAQEHNPRSVTFAQPDISYQQDLDDLLDLSSSEPESEVEDDYATSHVPTNVAERSERGLVRSTYLERNDYRALLESLRTAEQHDTARHLMSVVLLKRMPLLERERVSRRQLRKGWTAWPVPASETRHARGGQAAGELRTEVRAVLHERVKRRLWAEDKQVSADELPADMARLMADVVLGKVDGLLEAIAQARLEHAGSSLSSAKRVAPLTARELMTAITSSGLLASSSLERIRARSQTLLGADCFETDPVASPPPLVHEEVPFEQPVVHPIPPEANFESENAKKRKLQ